MDQTREKIYLAALLHDIGKFYQRADNGNTQESEYLKEHCKEEGTFCPLRNGYYSHKHVLWTAQFIDENKSVFQKLINSNLDDLTNKDNLINLAAGHHLSKEQLSVSGAIIKEADCLSSGMDRDSTDALNDDQAENSWDSFKKVRMTSILETIALSNEQLGKKSNWFHMPISKTELSENVFPRNSYDVDTDYKTLWNQFIAEFKFIQSNTYHAFSETFLSLLYKYTTCISASTVNFPDISLYDHLKTTAALSLCLYDVMKAKEPEDNPFLLIGADFSGIQPYIYQIVSKYAGKNLKGRSFYLRILSDTIVRYLLKELHLFQANVIYNSGGGFYILAPNTKFTRNQLELAISNIEEHLFKAHDTYLFVAIDSIALSKDALMHKNGDSLGKVWSDLFKLRDEKKANKFSSMISEEYDIFFNPSLQGGSAKRDTITGEEIKPDEKVFSVREIGVVKEITHQQIQMGEVLRNTEIIVVSEEDVPYWHNKVSIEPVQLGFHYYFLNHADLNEMKEQLRGSADKISVVTLNGENGNCDFLGKVDGINNIYSLEFYGGNEFNGKTFDELCDKQSTDSFKRLGVLRMDVDNLGSIFQHGILPHRATLSRYAALSRSFDFFFSGYINTICKKVAPDTSYIVYSGGDDLFIVGGWDACIAISKCVQSDFAKYTCNNPAFSISGGIAILPTSYPIMRGAKESEDEERKAKSHLNDGSLKNSISFMDTPLNWKNEFYSVESLKDAILDAIYNDNLPKSFISKVLAHAENANIQNHKINAVKTFWMLTYDLGRMSGRMKLKPKAQKIVDRCKAEVCGNNKCLNSYPIETEYHPLELWAFACRWAELEYRS